MTKKKIYFAIVLSFIIVMFAGCKKSEDKDYNPNSNVELGAYQDMEVLVEKSTITEANIQSYIERMIEKYAPEGSSISYETLTDEFVKTHMQETGYASVKELKESVSDYLNSTNDYYANNNTRVAIQEKLLEICTVKELSNSLLDERVEQYIRIFKSTCKKQYGMEFDAYLTSYEMTEEAFKTQVENAMNESLKIELILMEIGKKENLQIKDSEYQEFLKQMMGDYNYESEEAIYNDYGKDYLEDSFYCDKVMEMLLENVKVTYVAPGELP